MSNQAFWGVHPPGLLWNAADGSSLHTHNPFASLEEFDLQTTNSVSLSKAPYMINSVDGTATASDVASGFLLQPSKEGSWD